jgi:hypothetical protein
MVSGYKQCMETPSKEKLATAKNLSPVEPSCRHSRSIAGRHSGGYEIKSLHYDQKDERQEFGVIPPTSRDLAVGMDSDVKYFPI